MVDYRERRLRFWCQKVLPLVYDESLSYYELLCKIMKHLSEAETDVSALEAWLTELDEQAVKQVYSEYPLYAERENGQIILRARSAVQNIVTSVEAAEGSPITVGASGGASQGSLDPNDPEAPTGKTNVSRTITLDINNATETDKGVMSADDKKKLNRLYNTTVEAGDNIVVSSTTAANGDTNYVVGVDPNFQPQMQEWSLTGGEWEWNSMLTGAWNVCYETQVRGQVQVAVGTNTTPSEYTDAKNRLALNGVMLPGKATTMQYTNYYSTGSGNVLLPCYGVAFSADSKYPFATVTGADPIVSGETYFTTNNTIRVKCQLQGTGVANRDFVIYLGSEYSGASGTNYNNTYLTADDPYFPSSLTPYIPAKYAVRTDSNGYFDVTVPSGLTAKAITTASSITTPATVVNKLCIMAAGDPMDLYGNLNIDACKVAIQAQLN